MGSTVKNGAFSDISFVFIEWQKGQSPSDLYELNQIVEELDEQFFSNGVSEGITECLEHSYFPFYHAELLFGAIKQVFGDFSFKKISLANNDEGLSKGVFTPSVVDEVYLDDFTIDKDFTNILDAFIHEGFYGKCAKDYAHRGFKYDDVVKYFNEVLSAYQVSRDLTSVEMAKFIFPSAKDVEGIFGRTENLSEHEKNAERARMRSEYELKHKIASNNMKLTVLACLGLGLGLLSFGFAVYNNGSIKRTNTAVIGVYDELKKTDKLADNEHAVDVFSRYFLSYYYSGNKDSLKEFLSNGDAKYTQPDKASISSALLETIKLADDAKDTFEVTYVVSTTKASDNSTSTNRINFEVKKDNNSTYGYVVISEPVTSPYVSSSDK